MSENKQKQSEKVGQLSLTQVNLLTNLLLVWNVLLFLSQIVYCIHNLHMFLFKSKQRRFLLLCFENNHI